MRTRNFPLFRRYSIPAFVILLLLSGLVLISLRITEQKGVGSFDALLLEVCAPVQKAATLVFRSVQGVFHRYLFLVYVQEENEILKKRVAELHEENARMKELALANQRLRQLLQFREHLPKSMMVAEVIGQDPSSWFKSITIDKGERDGIQKGMAVIAPEGVVGQVLKVSPDYSTVLLITDYNSGIDAIVQRTRSKAIVEGMEENRCQLKYLLRTDDIVVGDVVVTSGMDGKFPKGLMVGEIQKVEKRPYGVFQYAELIPSVDRTKLEEIFVITESTLPASLLREDKDKKVKPIPSRRPKKK
jgi:rod shape-determining protein MreC